MNKKGWVPVCGLRHLPRKTGQINGWLRNVPGSISSGQWRLAGGFWPTHDTQPRYQNSHKSPVCVFCVQYICKNTPQLSALVVTAQIG